MLSTTAQETSLELKKKQTRKSIKTIVERNLKQKKRGKMFSIVTATWNPISGCLYNCNYCWAKNFALTRLNTTKRYSKGFIPSLNESEFKVKFSKGELIFVSDMGDMFSEFISDEWIKQVLDHIRKFPETYFLFMTKNPKRYIDLLPYIPDNAILGATIETTSDEIIQIDQVSTAPFPSQRYEAMKSLNWDNKIISIEPVIDFDLNTFIKWIEDIKPFIVYVGYDNYRHKLREPTLEKTMNLMNKLADTAIVIKKTLRLSTSEDKLNSVNEGK